MRILKIGIISIAILFTAQACNFLFGDIYGDKGSGPRGVYFSVDSGETWAAGSDEAEKLRNAEISEIFVEPGNPGNLLAASSNAGVLASDTGGERWVTLLPKSIAYSVFVNPQNSQEIFASGAGASSFATIWQSQDRGNLWREIFNESSERASVSAMTFDPQSPQVLYAALSTGTVIKSLDSGETWDSLITLDGRVARLLVSPLDSQIVYALSISSGVHQSTDGGQNWTVVNAGLKTKRYNDLAFDQATPPSLYLAAADGLFRSLSGGNTWQVVALPASEQGQNVTAVAVNPDLRSEIFAAIKWTIFKSDDGGLTWQTKSLPTRRTVTDIAVDPNEPNRVYAGVR